jgi:hypothetical protein
MHISLHQHSSIKQMFGDISVSAIGRCLAANTFYFGAQNWSNRHVCSKRSTNIEPYAVMFVATSSCTSIDVYDRELAVCAKCFKVDVGDQRCENKCCQCSLCCCLGFSFARGFASTLGWKCCGETEKWCHRNGLVSMSPMRNVCMHWCLFGAQRVWATKHLVNKHVWPQTFMSKNGTYPLEGYDTLRF